MELAQERTKEAAYSGRTEGRMGRHGGNAGFVLPPRVTKTATMITCQPDVSQARPAQSSQAILSKAS
jgi:hypothetical protein